MKRLLLAILSVVVIPACGGGSGGSPAPVPQVAPGISLDSVSPNPFTPPALTTVTYTLANDAALCSLNVYHATGAPNTLQFLGEILTGQKTPGVHQYAWDGYTWYGEDGTVSVPLPVFLDHDLSPTVGLYFVSVSRQTKATNGITTTNASSPEDLTVFYRLNYQTPGWQLDHAEDAGGNTVTFPRSGAVPGQPGFVYRETMNVYDVFLDTSTDTLTFSLNPTTFNDYSLFHPTLVNTAPRTYTLEAHAQNTADEAFSSTLPVTTP